MSPRIRACALVVSCSVLLGSGSASAGGVDVEIDLPRLVFAAPPPLVVVAPGVEVVEDSDVEIFHTGGYYWVRKGHHWHRARDHRGGWVVVEDREVPVVLIQAKPGKYKKVKGPKHHKGKKHGH